MAGRSWMQRTRTLGIMSPLRKLEAWRRGDKSPILVLPRTKVLERTYTVPTNRTHEITRILSFRLYSETPFLMEDLDWSWRIVGRHGKGGFLVKVVLVEKSRFFKYFEESALACRPTGVLVEDDLLTAWQDFRGSDVDTTGETAGQADGGVPSQQEGKAENAGAPEIHLYALPQRLLANLVYGGTSVSSNVVSLNGHFVREEKVRGLLAPLVTVAKFFSGAHEGSSEGIRLRLESSLQSRDLPLSGMPVGEPISTPDEETELGPSGQPALASLPGGGWVLLPDLLKDRRLAGWAQREATPKLLPETWRAEAKGRERLRTLAVIGAALLAVALGGQLTLSLIGTRMIKQRHALEETRSNLRVETQDVEAAQLLITRMEAGSGSTRFALSVWDRIAQYVLSGIKLTSISIPEGGPVVVHGTARSRAEIGDFMHAMGSDPSGLFGKVSLGGLKQSRTGEQTFHVRAIVMGNAADPREWHGSPTAPGQSDGGGVR